MKNQRKIDQKTISTKEPTKNKKTKIKRDKKEQLILEKKNNILSKFQKDKFATLYLDVFLIYVFSVTYGTYLCLMTSLVLGLIFLIFSLIFCTLISNLYYLDTKSDIESVMKDLEILFR